MSGSLDDAIKLFETPLNLTAPVEPPAPAAPAAPAVNPDIDKAADFFAPKPGFLERRVIDLQRGANTTGAGLGATVALGAQALGYPETARSAANWSADQIRRTVGTPRSEAAEAISKISPDQAWPDIIKQVWTQFQRDPLEVIGTVMAESAPAFLPATVAAPFLGPGGFAAAAGGTGAITEFANTVLDQLSDRKVDITNPTAVTAALADPKTRGDIATYAAKRAAVIGAGEALEAFIPARIIHGAGPSWKSRLGRTAGGTLLGWPMGAAGEAGAQLVTEGRINQPGAVALELAGSLPEVASEAGSFALGHPPAQAAPPGAPPVPPGAPAAPPVPPVPPAAPAAPGGPVAPATQPQGGPVVPPPGVPGAQPAGVGAAPPAGPSGPLPTQAVQIVEQIAGGPPQAQAAPQVNEQPPGISFARDGADITQPSPSIEAQVQPGGQVAPVTDQTVQQAADFFAPRPADPFATTPGQAIPTGEVAGAPAMATTGPVLSQAPAAEGAPGPLGQATPSMPAQAQPIEQAAPQVQASPGVPQVQAQAQAQAQPTDQTAAPAMTQQELERVFAEAGNDALWADANTDGAPAVAGPGAETGESAEAPARAMAPTASPGVTPAPGPATSPMMGPTAGPPGTVPPIGTPAVPTGPGAAPGAATPLPKRRSTMGPAWGRQAIHGIGQWVMRRNFRMDRGAVYSFIAPALGYTRDEFNALAPVRQIELVAQSLKDTFQVQQVVWDSKLPLAEVRDQLLNTYAAMTFMSDVLQLPSNVMSVGGLATMVIGKPPQGQMGTFDPNTIIDGKIYGVPGRTLQGPLIHSAPRNLAFAHEWMHALDRWLRGRIGPAVATPIHYGSESARLPLGGRLNMAGAPHTVVAAWGKLMSALFYDQADLVQQIGALENQMAALPAGDPQLAALDAQYQRLLAAFGGRWGAVKGAKLTGMIAGAAKQDAQQGALYFATPVEMVARAFEAYWARVAEMRGIGEAVAVKRDQSYLGGPGYFSAVYPQAADREAIFQAFDEFFTRMSVDTAQGGQVAAAPGVEHRNQLAAWDGYTGVTGMGSLLRAEAEAQRQIWGAIAASVMGLPGTVRGWFGPTTGPINNSVSRTAMETASIVIAPIASRVRMLIAKYEGLGQQGAARRLRTVMDNWVTRPGRLLTAFDREVIANLPKDERLRSRADRASASVEPFSYAVSRIAERWTGAIAERMRQVGLRTLTPADAAQVTAMLNQELDPRSVTDKRLVAVAAQMRQVMDQVWGYLRDLGYKVGYVKHGFLPRLIDFVTFNANTSRFTRTAEQYYGVHYDAYAPTSTAELMKDPRKAEFLIEAMKTARRGGLGDAVMRPLRRALIDFRDAVAANDPAKIATATAELDNQLATAGASVRASYAGQAAVEYTRSLEISQISDGFVMGPPTGTMHKRAMLPIADQIFAEFYVQNPIERVERYINAAVRRGEYDRRMYGTARYEDTGEAVRAKTPPPHEFERNLLDSGIAPEHINWLWEWINTITGRYQTTADEANLNKVTAAMQSLIVLRTLPRTILAQLADPISFAMRSGQVVQSLKMLALSMTPYVWTKEMRAFREFNSYLGLMLSTGAAEIRNNAYLLNDVHDRWLSGLPGKMFDYTGTTSLTNKQRVLLSMGNWHWMRALAHDIVGTDDEARYHAILDFADVFGIPREETEAFSRWLLSSEELPDEHTLKNTPEGQRLDAAMYRANRAGNQNPTAFDRPTVATSRRGGGISRLFFTLQSFAYANFLNIHRRAYDRVREGTWTSGMAAAYLGGVAIQITAMMAFKTLGLALWNPDQLKKLFEEGGGKGLLSLFSLGTQASIATPATGIVWNAFEGVRYNRSLAGSLVGPAGSFLDDMTPFASLFTDRNSPNTTASEHAAVRAAAQWGGLAATLGMASLPVVGPFSKPIVGLGIQAATSKRVTKGVADLTVGPQPERHKGGSKGGSQGTGGTGASRPGQGAVGRGAH